MKKILKNPCLGWLSEDFNDEGQAPSIFDKAAMKSGRKKVLSGAYYNHLDL